RGRRDRAGRGPRALRAWSVVRDGGVGQQVTGLALEHAADRLERREADGLRSPVLEHRDVRDGDAHSLGELGHGHLAARELDVEVHDDRHQMTSLRSSSSCVARTSRARMTAMRSASASPHKIPPVRTKNTAGGIAWMADRCTNMPVRIATATRTAHVMRSTQTKARGEKIVPLRTKPSRRQMHTIATWTHTTTAIARTV